MIYLNVQPTAEPIADRVTQHLEIILKTFNFVPGNQDSSGIHHLLLGTNRKSHGHNSGSLEKF